MWLFRLPRVTRHGPTAPRIAPVISLTVVLPLLPVMPTTVPSKSRRQAARERRQRRERVAHDDLRQRTIRRGRSTSAPAAPSAARLGHELVAVEALAAQRDEQRARLERARVGQHAARTRVGAVQRAAGDARELGEGARIMRTSPSAARARRRGR